jgi:bifunctional non-homologous end joining protein LigD
VGSGFSNGQLGSIRKQLEAWRREQPPLAPGGAELPRGPEHVWVEPRLVAEVRYKETTGGGQLRHPVFVRLRDDKAPEECVRDSLEHPEEPPAPPAPPPEASGPRRRLRLSNLDKVFWPGEGLTKGDLVAYYRAVAPALLPYLADRPVVLDRFPDGIEGKSFFQKNAPDGTPEWVRTEAVTAEDGKITRYLVADDEDTLLHLVNLGSIPLHLWASRVGSLQHPDWCILDLDAKDAPFAAAVEVARAAGELCRELGLTPYLKTSGASGLHVLLPLGGRVTHDQARQLAELLARLVASQLPALASVARLPQARAGKVYVDYLQNGFGKLLVAPYSVRPRPGAPVSTPLSWEELGPGLDPRHFTMATVPPRLAERGDPLAPVLAAASDLPAALARLARRVGKEG